MVNDVVAFQFELEQNGAVHLYWILDNYIGAIITFKRVFQNT